MINSNKKLGYFGEDAAVSYLKQKGYDVLERNWRFRHWEIDIIAHHLNEIVFIEVKTRQSTRHGDPEASVSLKKQRHLVDAAHFYIEQNNVEWPARFDIITLLKENNSFTVKHLESAFFPLIK